MSENITPEEYRSEISMLNHEIYLLQKQLEQQKEEQRRGSIADPYNPFDNPTDHPDYSGDYSDIVPQIVVPGCKIPVDPGKNEKKRIRKFYNIGSACMIFQFILTMLIAQVLSTVAMVALQFINPDASYDALSDYASGTAITTAITVIAYLITNVLFTFVGLKWAKIDGSSLMQTRNFGFGKALQYCVIAVFIQYAAALFTLVCSDVLEKYGFSTEVDNSGLAEEGIGFVILMIYQCIIAPITEELFFRGMLLKTFSRANQRFAIVATSVFFGLAHGNIPQFMLAFLLGMFLAHIDMKHNSLLPSVIVHIFINTLAGIINFISTRFPDEEMLMLATNLLYILIAIVGLAFFIEFSIKNKLPRTTPQQSRRGFEIAKTSVPTIIAFIILFGSTLLVLLSSKAS